MLELSTRVRYGTRALVQLAAAYPNTAVSASELAAVQKLSPKYLERILAGLKRAGLVKAARGMKGGYKLARAPQSISIMDVVSALEGPTCVAACVKAPETCDMHEACPTRDLWSAVQSAFEDVLGGTTLKDLVERKKRKASDEPPSYSI